MVCAGQTLARARWSLWEIMNVFDVSGLCFVLHEITLAEAQFALAKAAGRGSSKPHTIEGGREKTRRGLDMAEAFFKTSAFQDCLALVQTAQQRLDRSHLDVSGVCEILNRLLSDLVTNLNSTMFLRIADDRTEFMDKEQLFGAEVHGAFHSANGEIKEAGNCLAAENNTAAVFHLMRASEVALRALARDRNVAFKDKPLEQKEWGQILAALEEIIKGLRLEDGKRWADSQVREEQIRFYNEVLQELRGFNEAWRRHLSHAHAGALYDRDYALSVFKHVRAFLQKLARKVNEDATAPEFW